MGTIFILCLSAGLTIFAYGRKALSESMNNTMKLNTQNMMHSQKVMMLKQRQLMLAHQYAMAKDRFQFYKVFYGLALMGLVTQAIRTRNPAVAIPLVPLSFGFAYQWDMFVGNKVSRIKKDAENMIREHPELFFPAANNMLLTEEEYKKYVLNY